MDIKHLYILNPQQFTEEVKVLSIEPGEVPTFISAIFPDQIGNAGKFLETDGTNLLWGTTGGGGLITSVANTPTINLAVSGGGQLTAAFASLLVSQFTNDPPYAVGTASALTKTDDTNVTLTLGGTPNTALLQATSITVGWSGTLADGRIASAATWNAKLTSTLTSAHLFIGSAGNVATDTALSGDATITNAGVLTVGNNKISYGKMQQASTVTLLGNPTGVLANISEITLGSGLSFSGTTLVSTGTGGTVTTVSVVTNQGVSGSVANPTTTPAITLSLGALTGVTSFNGLVVTANTGAITTGSWAGTNIPLNKGGTNSALTASNGGIVYSTASAMAILSGTATASKMLLSGASTTPTWSTSTIPTSAGATANKVLLSDGTNYVLSTPTFPNASATANKFIISDGTNWIASTVTRPNSAITGDLLYASASNVYSNLADAATGNALISGGVTTAPSWGKIGLGTHVSGTLGVANGGTGLTSYIIGGLIYAQTTSVLAELGSTQPINSILMSGGVNLAPFWSTTIFPNSCSGGDIIVGTGANTYGNIGAAVVGKVLISQGIGSAPVYSTTINNSAGNPVFDINNLIIGDSTGWGSNSKLVIDDSNLLVYVSINSGVCLNLDTQNHNYKIGDVGALNNGSYLLIDDANDKLNYICKIGGANTIVLNLDGTNNLYQIGDISGFNNGTYLNINDTNQKISFIANRINATYPSFNSDALAGAGGLVTGDHYYNPTLSVISNIVCVKS